MLTSRTTYTRTNGTKVHIAGQARVDPIDGQAIFWSIEGDHYAATDGRFVHGRLVGGFGERRLERFLTDGGLAIDLTSADRNDPWWEGVVT